MASIYTRLKRRMEPHQVKRIHLQLRDLKRATRYFKIMDDLSPENMLMRVFSHPVRSWDRRALKRLGGEEKARERLANPTSDAVVKSIVKRMDKLLHRK